MLVIVGRQLSWKALMDRTVFVTKYDDFDISHEEIMTLETCNEFGVHDKLMA